MPSVKAPSQVAMKISVMKTGTKMKEDGIMKTRLFISIVIVWGLIGCTGNQEIDIPDANLSLFARTESPADTKTVVEEGVHVFWEPGDEIAVFMGEKSAKFTTDLTAASGTATFKGTFGDESWPEDLNLWAVYPYSEEATFDGETITTVLPSEQVAREGSFGKDMNLSIAHSTSASLQFYNVGGGIRFSVTEEGIKKVMFEGLSGEIISGKVKIGFDENGKPVVKEVTGGSQFITLLPPSGKETFEPGAWYYIVAIPGSLEGGYKLRFYKDSDYARKVSEKAVEIKRSIYGSLEKADQGIEFEPTTTKFPETKEEWEASLALTQLINDELDSKFGGVGNIRIDDTDALESITQLDGIIDIAFTPNMATLSLMQKDSIVINYFLDIDHLETENIAVNCVSLPTLVPQLRAKSNDSYYNPGISALVLAPCDGELLEYGANVDSLVNALIPVFGEDRITVLRGPQASFLKFYGDYLDNYDYIYINTHGGLVHRNSWIKETTGYFLGTEPLRTALVTGTKYDSQFIKDYISSGLLHKYSLFLADIGDTEKGEHDVRVCMTPEFLEEDAYSRKEASFDNSFVMIGACHSAEVQSGKESLMDAFIKKGAAFYSGYTDKMSSALNAQMSFRIVNAMAHGFSYQEAVDYILNCSQLKEYTESINRYVYDKKKKNHNANPQLLSYRVNDNISLPCRFIDPHPTLISANDDNYQTTFNWDSRFKSYCEQWIMYGDAFDYGYNSGYYKLRYFWTLFDVYVDGEKVVTDVGSYGFTANSASCSSASPGEHSWYVIAKIMEGDNVIASYQSDVGHFTVEESIATPEPIDLGLSVKWASFNLGATKPEEYGDYFAWGETATKDEYSWETYQWYDGDENHLTKYNATDHTTLLGMDDDVVQQKLKGMWRVPSVGEWQELMEQCTWNWTTRDGVAGYEVTSNLNGKTIYIPAAGYKIGNSIADSSIFGRYWLGTCYIEYMPDSAASGLIKSDIISWISSPRYMGLPIRPVMPIPVESVSLDKTSLQIPIGSKATLTAIILPENATVKDVIWSSSNPSIATVGSITGEITGIAAGSTVITATTVDGHFSAQCPVQVVVPVTGITLDKNTMTISEGETQTLMATVLPDNAYNKEVVWSSSNQAVATVTGDGKVTGVSAGSAVITATTSDGNKKATCRITVIKPIPINEIILSKNTLSMIVGESFTLTATILPSNATETDLSWKVDDSSVATVTDGKVTALKKGVTKVRAVHSYSSGLIVEGVCDVTVKDKSGSHEGTEEEGWQ